MKYWVNFTCDRWTRNNNLAGVVHDTQRRLESLHQTSSLSPLLKSLASLVSCVSPLVSGVLILPAALDLVAFVDIAQPPTPLIVRADQPTSRPLFYPATTTTTPASLVATTFSCLSQGLPFFPTSSFGYSPFELFHPKVDALVLHDPTRSLPLSSPSSLRIFGAGIFTTARHPPKSTQWLHHGIITPNLSIETACQRSSRSSVVRPWPLSIFSLSTFTCGTSSDR